jgi:histidyl-tRNA synthetase
MALSTQPYKGARDFYPEDKRLQKYMFAKMRTAVEKFGYEEYDAPILEPMELYLAKSGEQIVNEQTYVFTDRGDRQVVIRPEMTPTVSRMVAARRQELTYPLRWYSIPNLWRYERPQRGRLREHWQLNVDIFGVAGLEAELEIIQVADEILRLFGARHEMYTIKLNSRRLIDDLMKDYIGVDSTQAYALSKLIDRMQKMEYGEFVSNVEAVFNPMQRDEGVPQKLIDLLKIKDLNQLPETLKTHDSIEALRKLIVRLDGAGITNIVFDITLMRGFDYYTDIVFEIHDNHPENNRSMFGGGRYDGLVGLFGVEPVSTVGFGVGDVTLQNFLEVHGLLPALHPETDVYVIPIGDVQSRLLPKIKHLRDMGLKVAVDTTGRKPDKMLKAALKKDIHYVLFVGEKELEDEQYMLKNLHTAEEERHGLDRIVSIVKDYRRK